MLAFSAITSKISIRYFFIILIPLLATIGVFWKFCIIFQVPFRLDYAEGFVFTNTLAAFNGQSLYHSVNQPPYIFGFYTPLFNYIGAAFFYLLGVSLSILRILTLVFFIAGGVGVSVIIFRITKSKFAAILSATLFFSSFILSQWSAVARPDMLALALIIYGIYFATHPSYNTRNLMIAALLFALAFFTKQNFIFAPLAFAAWLLFVDKIKTVVFASAYICFVGIGIFAMHIATNGEFSRQIFLFAGAVPYGNVYTALRITVITCISSLPLLIVALKRVFSKSLNFFTIYFVVSCISFVMLLRDGGIQNYLLEFIVALILISITSFPWHKVHLYSKYLAVPYIILTQVFFVAWSFSAFPWQTSAYIIERENAFNNEKQIISSAKNILAEDPLLPYATHHSINIDPYTYGQVVESGLISAEPLEQMMKSGAYDYVVDYGSFSRIPEFDQIFAQYFTPIHRISFDRPVLPFDYSLFNRNTVQNIGTVYQYSDFSVNE